MDNKQFGLSFASVLAAALLFWGAANGGAYAVDRWLFPVERFGENTYIGTTDVSGLEVAEVQSLFAGQVESWYESSELLVTYQDVTASYPLESAQILLDETVSRAEDGAQNGFVFQLRESVTERFLADQFPGIEFTDEQVSAINNRLAEALEDGQRQTRVAVTDELLSAGPELIAEAAFPHRLMSPGAYEIVQTLSSYPLAPNGTFSFLDFIFEIAHSEVTDEELTEIASALYSAALQTNLVIEKRSIGTTVPDTVPLGQEASINRPLDIDLVLTNPNPTTVYLAATAENNILTGTISGYPLVYDYAISLGERVTVEPRLIKQFSSFVASGSRVEEFGSNGTRVNVVRTAFFEGEAVEVEPVSTDFYAPVHRVEVFPLEAAVVDTTPDANDPTNPGSGTIVVPIDPNNPGAGTIVIPANPTNPATPNRPGTNPAPGAGGGTGSGTAPGTGGSGSGTGMTPGTGGSGAGSGTGPGTAPGTGSGSGSGSGTSPGSGSNNGDVKGSPPVYDKGGNSVHND